MKIKYPYTKPQPPTPFNSKSHPSHFCTKLWSKTVAELLEGHAEKQEVRCWWVESYRGQDFVL